MRKGYISSGKHVVEWGQYRWAVMDLVEVRVTIPATSSLDPCWAIFQCILESL